MITTDMKPPTLVPARFGRNGTKVHYALGHLVYRHNRVVDAQLITSVPMCGTYTRPGAGWAMPWAEVTCTKCMEMVAENEKIFG